MTAQRMWQNLMLEKDKTVDSWCFWINMSVASIPVVKTRVSVIYTWGKIVFALDDLTNPNMDVWRGWNGRLHERRQGKREWKGKVKREWEGKLGWEEEGDERERREGVKKILTFMSIIYYFQLAYRWHLRHNFFGGIHKNMNELMNKWTANIFFSFPDAL